MVWECLERERAAKLPLSAAGRKFVALSVAGVIPMVLKRLRHRTLGQSLQAVSWRWAQLALLLKSELPEAEFAQLETKAREAVPAPAGQPGWQVLAAGLDQRATSDDLRRWLKSWSDDLEQRGGWTFEGRVFFKWLPPGLRALPEAEDAAHKIVAAIEIVRRVDLSSTAIKWNDPAGLPIAIALRKLWGTHTFGKLVHIWRARYNPPPNTSDDWLVSCVVRSAKLDTNRLTSLYHACLTVGSELDPQDLAPRDLAPRSLAPQDLAPQDRAPQEVPFPRMSPGAVTGSALEARTAFLERQYTGVGRPDAAEAAKVDAAAIQADLVERRTALLARVISESGGSRRSSLSDAKASQLTQFVSGWAETALREANGNGMTLTRVELALCSWRWLLLADVMIEKMDSDGLQGLLSQAETVIPRPKNVGKQWYLACVLDALISRALLNVWLTDKFGLTEPGWFSPEVLYVEYFPHDNPVRLPITPNGERLVLALCTFMHRLTKAETRYHTRFVNPRSHGFTWLANKQDVVALRMLHELEEPLFSEIARLWRDSIPAPCGVDDCRYLSSLLKLSHIQLSKSLRVFRRWEKMEDANGRGMPRKKKRREY
ncbi:hypothetical protein GNI_011920 [Gregarina niphandrodes]|uniref:Uncharacterized protein n=1 Tax=Gregarina niphandrodes TaxID=110365 RepID=A0A023BCZ5_GRENI|nr:hypothetical protein GNI_011920 [Gregarina niphandrodes]EZG85283.1 hypothetical protein GNI_011920 [Gregarina niphandrodes]|eukprot:XP_011128834.1 hypothetical protein GNI_011920 [Gregarina niphandrodes]